MNAVPERREGGVVLLALLSGWWACGDGPSEPAPGPSPAAIVAVSGQGQEGTVGEPLAEPLVVRVTDPSGAGVRGVPVTWRILSGAGGLRRGTELGTTATAGTDAEGLTGVVFVPFEVGASTVIAEAAGLDGSPIAFEAEASGPVGITFWDFWRVFTGPDGSADVTVPVGTTVRWATHPEFRPETWTVTATDAPPDGASFGSGILRGSDAFEFVPDAAGTWRYVDEISGAAGTITAR